VWISWQTNPTSVGHREQPVAVLNGDTPLGMAHRTLTIFP
jgi:hypothetical protein